ncbi:MAG TPA: GNAT family N-acetyltransferase [Xanthobacteraceae bacterium]|nr:GNAT family N-acetyltransferase [Xanthobacteraceae bacterium]
MPAYAFRPLTSADLPQMRRWLAQPHVAEWWGEPEAQVRLVADDLREPAMKQFIVALGERAFAYIQCYDPDDWPPQPFGPQPAGTCAIDQFIGEPDMVNCGHGSAFVRAFADRLIEAGAPRVLTDPDPANRRAVRAYEKAGFRSERLVDTPDGPALLMRRDA